MKAGELAVAIVVAFGFGVLVRDVAQDYRDAQREAAPLPVSERSAALYPARASLLFPLCEPEGGGWVALCADGRDCRFACLPAVLRVDNAGTP